jgi:YD repeat-containing protein
VAPRLSPRIKHLLKRIIVIAISSALALTALAYALDYVIFNHRLTTNHQPFGQITVTTYDAIAQKSGRTQFIFNPPEVQTCVNALFPRQGYVPCWYLQRHAEQRIDM